MKKLLPVFLLIFMASLLWGVSPKPGSGLTYDGSIMHNESVGASWDGVRRASALTQASVSTTGSKKILVILAAFNDYSFNQDYASTTYTNTHDTAYYSNLLQDSTEQLTMKSYYQQQSRGNLNLSFQVLGPYAAANGYAYYGENDIYKNDKRPGALVYEMLNKVKNSTDADLDNCTVIIIHAGPGEEEGSVGSNFIWSHRSSLTEKGMSTVTDKNGTVFNDYIMVPEYTLWTNQGKTYAESTIGTVCHEFGHILGLPDAYDTLYATAGVGQWSLMGGGEWGSMGKYGVAPGTDPAPFMAWELVRLGWIDEEKITLESGGIKYCTFGNMNDSSKVLRVDLCSGQYLTFEGKAENLTGSGMVSYEKGLLITQIHEGIVEKYGAIKKNTMNATSYRPHGSMVVEAVAANYKTNGLGNLWRGSSNAYRTTTTALFRSDTLTSVGPEGYGSSTTREDSSFLLLFISTILGSGIVISVLATWYAGRRKLCAVIAAAAVAVCVSLSCTISTGDDSPSGGTNDKGPNTNYYTTITNVHTKTGYSGITIYNITCDDNGSGSFYIKKN